ncbi:hypothetical protein [Rubrolithibacter danxiaensis]|uniref:hypothetical protein n=1 Tax=Rubrolithibacter danxiaensis TaxID=3390805 RepID=UPI003BF839F4
MSLRIRLVFVILFFCWGAYAQQKEKSLSISCYVNPELYLKAGIIAYVSDKAAHTYCKGSYVTLYNGSSNSVFYRFSKSGNWREVQSKQRVIIPARSTHSAKTQLSVVSLSIRYTEEISGDVGSKISSIAKMNAQSDKAKAKGPAGVIAFPGENNTPGASKGTTSKTIPAPIAKSKSKAAVIQHKPLQKRPEKPAAKKEEFIEEEVEPTSPRCFLAADTAYFTFYYIKLRDTVLYSDPFPVERYDNQESGKKLLSEAWGCLSTKLIERFGEDTYNNWLNDVDHDLMIGLNHLRNPQFSSSAIFLDYPYTHSFSEAKAEMRNWMEFDKKKSPGIQFVKIAFP